MNDIDRAERTQALKAFVIPASLFIACLFNAAGIYIMYAGSAVGMIFIGIGLFIIIASMFLFITFHNKQREQGNYHRVEDMTPPQDEPLKQWGATFDQDQTPVDSFPAYKPKTPTNVR